MAETRCSHSYSTERYSYSGKRGPHSHHYSHSQTPETHTNMQPFKELNPGAPRAPCFVLRATYYVEKQGRDPTFADVFDGA